MDELDNAPEWAVSLLKQMQDTNRLMRENMELAREIQTQRTEAQRKADEETERKAELERQMRENAREWAQSLPDKEKTSLPQQPHYPEGLTDEEYAKIWASTLPDKTTNF